MSRGQLNTVDPIDETVVASEPIDSEANASEPADSETTVVASEPETAAASEGHVLSTADAIKAATQFLQSEGYVVRMATASQRATLLKADPDEVRKYFDSTGLTRAQLADALGITVSVISTVQNPLGDRWSQTRFEAAKILIGAYKTALEQRIAATLQA